MALLVVVWKRFRLIQLNKSVLILNWPKKYKYMWILNKGPKYYDVMKILIAIT